MLIHSHDYFLRMNFYNFYNWVRGRYIFKSFDSCFSRKAVLIATLTRNVGVCLFPYIFTSTGCCHF